MEGVDGALGEGVRKPVEDPFWGPLISSYPSSQAVEDGIKIELRHELYCTTNLAHRLARGEDGNVDGVKLLAVTDSILDKYYAGIYEDPPGIDEYKEADEHMAIYEREGERVWAIKDGEGLHLILPEDY